MCDNKKHVEAMIALFVCDVEELGCWLIDSRERTVSKLAKNYMQMWVFPITAWLSGAKL